MTNKLSCDDVSSYFYRFLFIIYKLQSANIAHPQLSELQRFVLKMQVAQSIQNLFIKEKDFRNGRKFIFYHKPKFKIIPLCLSSLQTFLQKTDGDDKRISNSQTIKLLHGNH